MASTDLLTERPVRAHHPVGASTGWLGAGERRSGAPAPAWPVLAALAAEHGADACEFAALAEPELAGLVAWLEGRPQLPFGFVSLHAPSKQRALPEAELVALLERAAPAVGAIVLHPDVIGDPALWARLGRTLVLENMDPRKQDARTADELARWFAVLPQAGLCFDVAHAQAIDPSLAEGHRILDRFGDRLRHVHVSLLDAAHHHVPLDAPGERELAPLLRRCRDVPWILEAPLA